jgi:hypothetical protein
MKIQLNTIPALATRAVPPSQTYAYGRCRSGEDFGLTVRNGQLVEKTSRRNVFFQRHNIVKA